MYSKKSKKNTVITKIGKVTVSLNRNSVMIRFTHNKNRYEFSIGKDSEECRQKAKDTAHQIERDIYRDEFDATCVKYGKKPDGSSQPVLAVIRSETLNLQTLWVQFKEFKIKTNSVERSTVEQCYRQTERCLAKVNDEFYEFENAAFLLDALLEHYSPGTLARVMIDINACVNWAVERELIEKNPYAKLKKRLSHRSSSRAKETFELEEIGHIIAAFKDDRFNPIFSVYKHSHFTNYVQFLALTGFRPEEAIALTWNDFKEQGDRLQITVTKAYTHGILKNTKTKESRIFPCNDELAAFIRSLPSKHDTLVFPSQDGQYIHQANFLRRYWKPIVEKLVTQGLVKRYLPSYHLRHSFITRLARTGLSVDTIATLSGTSREMIFKHYLGNVDVESVYLPASNIPLDNTNH